MLFGLRGLIMLEIELSAELERHLENVATLIGETPGDLARKALLKYLEDLEDYMVAEHDQVHEPSTKAA
jgi:predicted DNA-binding protein